MSVILNEAGIQRLFSNPEGPVGREIERLAQRVEAAAELNARFIMHRNPALIDGMIRYRLEEGASGIQAVVGVVPSGKVSEYLDEKAAAPKEGEGWMKLALREVFP